MRLVITLPLPPAALSPNARVHWAKKARAVKACREIACLVAKDARNRAGLREPFAAASIKATFYFKDERRRDKDNFLSRGKPVWDGLADANVVQNDAAFTYLPVEFKVDKSDPRLELIIEGE